MLRRRVPDNPCLVWCLALVSFVVVDAVVADGWLSSPAIRCRVETAHRTEKGRQFGSVLRLTLRQRTQTSMRVFCSPNGAASSGFVGKSEGIWSFSGPQKAKPFLWYCAVINGVNTPLHSTLLSLAANCCVLFVCLLYATKKSVQLCSFFPSEVGLREFYIVSPVQTL